MKLALHINAGAHTHWVRVSSAQCRAAEASWDLSASDTVVIAVCFQTAGQQDVKHTML